MSPPPFLPGTSLLAIYGGVSRVPPGAGSSGRSRGSRICRACTARSGWPLAKARTEASLQGHKHVVGRGRGGKRGSPVDAALAGQVRHPCRCVLHHPEQLLHFQLWPLVPQAAEKVPTCGGGEGSAPPLRGLERGKRGSGGQPGAIICWPGHQRLLSYKTIKSPPHQMMGFIHCC